jgi:riboflavin synthase
MFTGLIETTGTILAVEQREGSRRIAIAMPAGHGISLRTGDSIAVSGVCLTALDIEPGRFHAELAAETVDRTSLSLLAPGSSLEPADVHADPALADWRLRVAVPAQLSRYMVAQGSIAIEGISLTIARWEPGTAEGDVVSVAIIPHTYARTNLHALKARQPVNIEADVLIKFMEQRALKTHFDLSVEYLIANGY